MCTPKSSMTNTDDELAILRDENKTVELLWHTLKDAVAMIDAMKYASSGDGAHEDTFDALQQVYRKRLKGVLTGVALPLIPDEVRHAADAYNWLRSHAFVPSHGTAHQAGVIHFGAGIVQTQPILFDMAISAQRKLSKGD